MTTSINTPEIKALAFDVGGVLALDAPRYFLSELAVREQLDVEDLVRIWRACLGPLVRGEISEDAFWGSFISELNLREQPDELLARFKKEIRLFLLLDKAFFESLVKLKAAINAHRKDPVRFAILSNQAKEWAEVLEGQADLHSMFECMIYSFNEKMTKPAREIFQKLIDQLEIKPAQILFIDNREKNLRAAKELGMHAILFTTPEEFSAAMAHFTTPTALTAKAKQ